MLMLLVFGVLHILLFWFGDILTSYAFLGLLLIPFRKLSNRNILILGSGFLLFRPLYYSGVEVFNWPMVNMERPFELNDFIGIYQDGNYVEIFKVRMSEFLSFMPENLVWYLPKTFGLFFIGMYAARKSFFALLRKNSPAYLTISIGLIFGSIAWNLYKADFFSRFDLEAAPHWRPVLIGINVFFETCLGIGYIIAFSLAFQKSKLLCKILARTGRLALTNYFIQSFVCVILFYGYGLGYYAKLVPSDLVLIAVLLFSFNVIFSYFYLAYKQIGPLEYVWRKGMSSKERSTNKGFTRES